MLARSARTVFKPMTRSFWQVAKGQATGRIEEYGENGLFINHDYIKFRETSSNMANGESYEVCLSKHCSKNKEIINKIKYALENQSQVNINLNTHLFNLPWYSDILVAYHLTDISIKDQKESIKIVE